RAPLVNAVQLVNAITPRNDKRPAVAASRLGRRVRTRKTPGVQSTRHRTRGRTLHEDFGFIPWVRTRWRVVSPPFNSVGDTFSNYQRSRDPVRVWAVINASRAG